MQDYESIERDNAGGNTVSKLMVTDQPLATTEHLGTQRQYWRDIILGVNDGIVSSFLLVTGVAGGGLTSKDILLTAIAGALAGAVSMFAGEYVATKSQNEVLDGEITLERAHIEKYRSDEMKELSILFDVIGIPSDDEDDQLRQKLLQYYERKPESLLKAMVALEFGVIEREVRSPAWAGATSLTSFAVGALPSVLPFAFAEDAHMGLLAAAVLTFFALIAVGIVKSYATHGNYFKAACENLMIASVGTGIAYGFGAFFDSIIH